MLTTFCVCNVCIMLLKWNTVRGYIFFFWNELRLDLSKGYFCDPACEALNVYLCDPKGKALERNKHFSNRCISLIIEYNSCI